MFPNPKKFFLIEDEQGITQAIKIQLNLVGYEVINVASGKAGLQSKELKEADIILLDWMLPDKQGPDLIPEIRKKTNVPILMLTARSELLDNVAGLEAGADDYLTKPFDMLELIARIKALTRRRELDLPAKNDVQNIIEYGGLRYNTDTRMVTVEGEKVNLTPTELKLMEIFMNNPGKVFSREDLISRVLGYEYEGYGRTLDSHIARLRSKIEKDPGNPRFIITVFGIGYKFGSD